MKVSLQSVQDELKPQAIQHVSQNGVLTERWKRILWTAEGEAPVNNLCPDMCCHLTWWDVGGMKLWGYVQKLMLSTS